MSDEDVASSTVAATKTVFASLANWTLIAAGIALLAMTVIQSWQVFARYVLNQSPGWTEPLALIFKLRDDVRRGRVRAQQSPLRFFVVDRKRCAQGCRDPAEI